ncbi:MAG: four helix bundle protein [Bacteroidia bacterium]|nr:four helix bundle protein [Bacteroidia bacterium]
MGKFKRAHENLDAWIIGMDVVDAVYAMTRKFPKDELFVLSSQMRRAAISIPTNIAEGSAKDSFKETLRYYTISRGSLSELETEVKIAERQHYIENTDEIDALLDHESRVLSGLINSVRRKIRDDRKPYRLPRNG